MKNCCPNCGYEQHSSHNSTFCPDCGTKLVKAADSRDVCPEERQRAFQEYIAAKEKFEKLGGKIP